jgi:hypothetical protein
VCRWLRAQHIATVKPISRIPEGFMYYTNFELASVHWFRESPYWQMYEVIDRTGGIYTTRWGDAPIHGLGVSLFMADKRKTELPDVHYRHQKFVC